MEAERKIGTLRFSGLTVSYDLPLAGAAREAAEAFPGIRRRLENTFGLEMKELPDVFLVGETSDFLKMTRNPLTVAFASPSRNLIVIDQSRMRVHPFTLESTLAHEACHIILHQHVSSQNLPRWLDEGLCQWFSNSIDEILLDQKASARLGAVLARRPVPMRLLQHRFPRDRESRRLAYEASKRFTLFLVRGYGVSGISDLLKHLGEGLPIQSAALAAFSTPLERIEAEWQEELNRRSTWFRFLAYYLYEILFTSMALVTIYGYIRFRIRKRRYTDEADNEEPPGIDQW